jgi:subtilisin
MRALRQALLLTLFVVAAAQAQKPPNREASSGTEPLDPRILVVLPKGHPTMLDRRTRELAGQHRLAVLTSWTMASLQKRCVVYEVIDRNRFNAILRHLRNDPRAELVQEIQRFETLGQDAKKSYAGLQHGAATLQLERVHATASGRNVRVGLIDTGVDINHPELAGRIEVARDFAETAKSEGFTPDVHGTAVAGVIAAADDRAGILGVAPAARLWALKACWAEKAGSRQAACDSYTLALALDFAIDSKLQVINLSLRGPEDAVVAALVGAALARGIVVVAATEDGSSFPSSIPGVLAVLSGGRGDGAKLEAPGDEILTTVPGGSFDFFSGSSFAAAHVTGIAALILEHRPQLAPNDLEKLLFATRAGPRVDPCAALANLLARPSLCLEP